MSFSRTIVTKDGFQKQVVADTLEELAEALSVAATDKIAASPDINNPDHGNVVVAEFKAELPTQVLAAGKAKPRAK
jgi:hypothetical protein